MRNIKLFRNVLTHRKLNPSERKKEAYISFERILLYRALIFSLLAFMKTTMSIFSGHYCTQMSSELMQEVDKFKP